MRKPEDFVREHKAEVLNSPNGNSVKGVNGVHTLALPQSLMALPPKVDTLFLI